MALHEWKCDRDGLRLERRDRVQVVEVPRGCAIAAMVELLGHDLGTGLDPDLAALIGDRSKGA